MAYFSIYQNFFVFFLNKMTFFFAIIRILHVHNGVNACIYARFGQR